MPSIIDRLKSLGVQVGAQDLPPPRRPDISRIDEIAPGRVHQTSTGETYIIEKEYPLEFKYGHVSLKPRETHHPLLRWANNSNRAIDSNDQISGPDSFAYLDIETTGLMGGAGTYAFLVGVGRFEPNRFLLQQFFMRDPSEEPAHLLALEEFLAPCEILVTYNGKSFDAPLLNTRYQVQGWKSPLTTFSHIDLLHLARRFWHKYLPSRTLGTIETSILGVHRSREDIPGWMIPQLYFDYLRSGDASPLHSVFYHNEMDVLALAALLNHLTLMFVSPPTGSEHAAHELAGMGRFYEDLGNLEEASQVYEACLACNLKSNLHWDTLERLSFIKKRQGDLDAARNLWEQAAKNDDIYAFVELAKFFEHHKQDYAQALNWTQMALKVISEANSPRYLQAQWIKGLEHRQARLKRKMRSSY